MKHANDDDEGGKDDAHCRMDGVGPPTTNKDDDDGKAMAMKKEMEKAKTTATATKTRESAGRGYGWRARTKTASRRCKDRRDKTVKSAKKEDGDDEKGKVCGCYQFY